MAQRGDSLVDKTQGDTVVDKTQGDSVVDKTQGDSGMEWKQGGDAVRFKVYRTSQGWGEPEGRWRAEADLRHAPAAKSNTVLPALQKRMQFSEPVWLSWAQWASLSQLSSSTLTPAGKTSNKFSKTANKSEQNRGHG